MTQNRINWSDPRISPAVYEDMVAVLISRLHTEAQRIDGSGGDGGRDVQLPLSSGLEIFELKSFTGRLTLTRRRQVESSLKNAAKHSPSAWHLVVPINHNPTEIEWFNELTKNYAFPCDWLGQDWLDSQMASHPDLPRYYIEGSSDEIVRVLRELNKEQAYLSDGLPDAVERISVLTNRLNEIDPHYAFAFSASPVDGIRIAILPRYPGAERDSKIWIHTSFNFPDTEAGQAAAAALSDTFSYGVPGRVAEEFVSSVTIGGIGGLENVFTGAVAFGPAEVPPDSGTPEMALQLVNEYGIAIAQLPMKFVGINRGTQGGDLSLTDYSGAIEVTIRFDVPTRRLNLNYKYSTPETILPGSLLPPLQFLCGVKSGLHLVILANGEPQNPPISGQQEMPDGLTGFTQLVADLDEIQRRSGIYFPMPQTFSLEELENILTAKQLLAGEVVSGEWNTSKMTMPLKSLEAFKELASIERPLSGRFPYHLSLEGRDYPLGYVLRTQAAAKIADWPDLSQVDDPDALVEVTFLPGADKSLTMKLLTIEELNEAAKNETDS